MVNNVREQKKSMLRVRVRVGEGVRVGESGAEDLPWGHTLTLIHPHPHPSHPHPHPHPHFPRKII